MKRILLLTVLGGSLLLADAPSNEDTFSTYLSNAVQSVEDARKDALKALNTMVAKVDATEHNNTKRSVSTQIVETQSLAVIAENTAKVEIAKTNAIAQISKAVDAIDAASKEDYKAIRASSYKSIIDAIASVEIAKAHAAKHITLATQRVEVSKSNPKSIPHEEETLSIAKNISAVKIAKSVAKVEVAKSNSYIEIAKSSMKNIVPTLSNEDKEKIENIKAKATAKISSYLTEIEVLKAKIEAKIAKEVAKVEVATSTIVTSESK